MKLLHTSDWYLGQKLYGKDLSVFQDSIIEEIAMIAENKNVDVVIVSGNIFSNDVISHKELSIFLKAVEKITNGGKRAMVVTLGENDNRKILDSFSYLSKRYNLACITSVNTVVDFDEENSFEMHPVESGRGYISYLTKDSEKVVIGAFCMNDISDKNENNIIENAIKNIDSVSKRFSYESINIISGNAVLELQNQQPEDDRLSVRIFRDDTTYVALGGMNQNEVCDLERNAYYCGGILPNSVDESKGDKGVIIATITGEDKQVKKEFCKLKSSKKLKKVRCSSINDAKTQLQKYEDCLVELTLSLAEPLKDNEHKRLYEEFPNLFELNLVISAYKGEKKKKDDRINMDKKDLFKSFVLNTTDETTDNDLVELFCQLTK